MANKVFNLPNMLTIGRVAAIPVMLAAYYFLPHGFAEWTAFAIFAAAAITDFFDGWLARRWSIVSDLGRMLDPIADKLLVSVVLVMLVDRRIVVDWHVLPVFVILVREILISGLREALAGVRLNLPVTQLAKWKTTAQLFSLGFLIVGPQSPALIPSVEIGLGLLWLSAVLTVMSGWTYLRAGIAHIVAQDQQK